MDQALEKMYNDVFLQQIIMYIRNCFSENKLFLLGNTINAFMQQSEICEYMFCIDNNNFDINRFVNYIMFRCKYIKYSTNKKENIITYKILMHMLDDSVKRLSINVVDDAREYLKSICDFSCNMIAYNLSNVQLCCKTIFESINNLIICGNVDISYDTLISMTHSMSPVIDYMKKNARIKKTITFQSPKSSYSDSIDMKDTMQYILFGLDYHNYDYYEYGNKINRNVNHDTFYTNSELKRFYELKNMWLGQQNLENYHLDILKSIMLDNIYYNIRCPYPTRGSSKYYMEYENASRILDKDICFAKLYAKYIFDNTIDNQMYHIKPFLKKHHNNIKQCIDLYEMHFSSVVVAEFIMTYTENNQKIDLWNNMDDITKKEVEYYLINFADVKKLLELENFTLDFLSNYLQGLVNYNENLKRYSIADLVNYVFQRPWMWNKMNKLYFEDKKFDMIIPYKYLISKEIVLHEMTFLQSRELLGNEKYFNNFVKELNITFVRLANDDVEDQKDCIKMMMSDELIHTFEYILNNINIDIFVETRKIEHENGIEYVITIYKIYDEKEENYEWLGCTNSICQTEDSEECIQDHESVEISV